MIIKKYQAKTEAEATENAKKELGDNVVVMNVRSVKRKGLFAFLKPKMTEVTVALEEESERYPVVKKSAAEAKKGQVETANASIVKEPPKEIVKTEVIVEKVDNSALEEKLDSLHNILEKQLLMPEADKAEGTETENKDEVNKENKEKNELMVFMKLLYNTMIDNEVDEKYANQIIEEIEKVQKPNMPFDYALANTYQKMILKFGKPETISPAKEGPKVIFFVGPTGVGKTTTIAKLASKFMVEEKKSGALLTADTYRIAAAEQLRTYANILEVPFKVIYTIEDLETAIEENWNCDYIFVDTAGHSHKNSEQRNDIMAFIKSVSPKVEKEVYLVVSATTKYKDLLNIADTYSSITDFKLIFTKLDETTEIGNLLNLRLYTNASLSYITNGQNVPDDIEKFNPQKTVKQLLGGKK